MSNLLKMMAGAGIAAPLYVDDVFVSYVRTGTGAEATITTNIDMTEGYALWSKGRSGATDHSIYHSARGVTKDLVTNTTAAETTEAQGLKSVSATGHTLGTLAKINTNAATYVDWVMRDAPNFYGHQVVVKSGGSNQTALFPELTTLGMVRVKRTDVAGSWYVWHRSLTAGKLLIGETTAAEATLGHITVSGTTVTLVNGVIADGTYLVEAWAHDTSSEGIVQCGAFTTDGSGNATVTLGWEPQYLLTKTTTAGNDWVVNDLSRGFIATGASNRLNPNTSNAEVANEPFNPTATGFRLTSWYAGGTPFIYLAIRRPNKPPTVGTQVYNAIARTGTGAVATVTGVGFAPDLLINLNRNANGAFFFDRLRGGNLMVRPPITAAETTGSAGTTIQYDMGGCTLGADTYGGLNVSAATYAMNFFRRAPGFFDEVCYTGTGAVHTISHNLGVVPELIIAKQRGATARDWAIGGLFGSSTYTVFYSPDTSVYSTTATYTTSPNGNYGFGGVPTATTFTVDTTGTLNFSTYTYVAYLFASLPGISKVGNYTGTAATLQINCGFTTGARFVLIKRTDAVGDWYVWDTVRGIIAGNDPYLLLNSTAAEVTTTDYIDPYSAGFEISSTAPAAINASGGTFIFLAIA